MKRTPLKRKKGLRSTPPASRKRQPPSQASPREAGGGSSFGESFSCPVILKKPLPRTHRVDDPCLICPWTAEPCQQPESCSIASCDGDPIAPPAPRPTRMIYDGPAELQPRPKRPALRSSDFLDFVRRQPCCVCGSTDNVQASHHGAHGVGTKADDFGCLPLCGTTVGREGCHQMQHRGGMYLVLRDRTTLWRLGEDGVAHFIAHHQARLLIEWIRTQGAA